MPAAAVEQHEDEGFRIPADAPERGVGCAAADPARAGDLGKLVAPHELPIAGARPLAECAARGGGVGQHVFVTIPVVGVDQAPLARIQPFAVVAGQSGGECGERGLDGEAVPQGVAIADQRSDGQRVHIHLVESLLHRGVVYFARGIAQVTGIAGEATGHAGGRDHADPALGIDHIGTDEQLVRLGMNHPVRRGAAHALGAGDLPELRGDFVEFVARAVGHMRPVGDHPKPVRPGHHGAGAALALGVEHREAGVDAAD